jgi:hypothetical protein
MSTILEKNISRNTHVYLYSIDKVLPERFSTVLNKYNFFTERLPLNFIPKTKSLSDSNYAIYIIDVKNLFIEEAYRQITKCLDFSRVGINKSFFVLNLKDHVEKEAINKLSSLILKDNTVYSAAVLIGDNTNFSCLKEAASYFHKEIILGEDIVFTISALLLSMKAFGEVNIILNKESRNYIPPAILESSSKKSGIGTNVEGIRNMGDTSNISRQSTNSKQRGSPKLIINGQFSKNSKLFKLFISLLILTAIIFSPQVLLFTSVSFWKISFALIGRGETKFSLNGLRISRVLTNAADREISFLPQSVGTLTMYKTVVYRANLLRHLISISEEVAYLTDDVWNLKLKLFGYEAEEANSHINILTEHVLQEIGFYEAEMLQYDKYLNREQLNEIKNSMHLFDVFFTKEKELLGYDHPVSYVIISEDNNYINPSGGKIRSLMVVKISGGEIIDTKIYSAKDFGLSIEGNVETPKQYSNYFGKTLAFEDIGWFSSFKETSQKVEWFTDKVLNEKIEGVVTFNNDVFDKFDLITSNITGKSVIKISDFRSSNEKLERNKLEEMLRYFEKSEKNRLFSLLNLLKYSFDNNSGLVFVNDPALQQEFDSLGWSGKMGG